MSVYVADTHALFWYLTASPKIGQKARQIFDDAAEGRATIAVPTIVLAELYFLHEKAGRHGSFEHAFNLLVSAGQFLFVPLEANHVGDFEVDQSITEMHDRIIVGVARRMNATLLSRDDAITASGLIKVEW